ncbi:MAG TPA: cyclic nucleotide-binding domain-containing protein [Chloroflexota bacterium]
MSTEEKTNLLRRSDLFAELEPDALRELATRARELEFPAGHLLVRQGEIGTGFYVIVSGRAHIIRHNERVDILGPGDSFGELAILDQGPRTANVRAEEPLTVLGLASWELNALLEEQPKVTLALLRQVVRRLRPHLTGHRH